MGSRNRFKNRLSKTKDSNLSRAELIKKYGLSTFREDPQEQAALNASKPSPDFSKDPKYASTGGPNGNKFIGDNNTTGGTGAKGDTTPRRQNFKMRLGYPLARGPGEKTGDTLLINGTGRTDFQNGNAKDAYNSIFNKLLKLPEETFLYPAHDYKGEKVSTIGKEKKQNPRLQVNSVDEYVEIMNNLNLKKPAEIETNVAKNIKLGA